MAFTRFNSLPAELRNKVYEMALTHPGGFEVGRGLNRYALRTSDIEVLNTYLALSDTCRQIRRETNGLLYKYNEVSADVSERLRACAVPVCAHPRGRRKATGCGGGLYGEEERVGDACWSQVVSDKAGEKVADTGGGCCDAGRSVQVDDFCADELGEVTRP